MAIRKLFLALCVGTVTLIGVPTGQGEVGGPSRAAADSRIVWYAEVSITRHGQRASQTMGPYSSKANAQAAYRRFVSGLERGANPSLDRLYSRRL